MEYDSLGESEKSRSEIEKSNTATSCPTSVNDFELNFSEGTLQQRKARRTSLSTSVVKVHEKQTILEMVLAALRKAFVSNIPVDALKSLRPKRLMYFTGFIAQVMATLLFLYFVKTVYDSNINQSFMALDPSVGNCNEVVKSVTATVSADSDGVWDSIPTFSYPKQMYEMEFNDIMITTDEYQKIMLLWRSEVTALGTRIGVQLDLSQNLILLATWQIYCSESISEACKHFEGQLFHFSASANVSKRVLLLLLLL